MSRQTALPAEGRIEIRRRRIASATWWLFWLLGSLWICRALALAWPYVNLPPQVVLLFTIPGLLFRSTDLGWMLAVGRPLARGWRWLARIVAVPCGLLLATGLWHFLDEISMARFERALAPLLRQVEANIDAPCPPTVRYLIGPDLAAYLKESAALPTPLALHYGGRRYLLVAAGHSIDIDGSTVFYDSGSRAWKKFHNDARESADALNLQVKDMKHCRIALH